MLAAARLRLDSCAGHVWRTLPIIGGSDYAMVTELVTGCLLWYNQPMAYARKAVKCNAELLAHLRAELERFPVLADSITTDADAVDAAVTHYVGALRSADGTARQETMSNIANQLREVADFLEGK